MWVAGFAAAAAMLAVEAVFRENVLGGLVLGTLIAPQVMAGIVLLESSRLARVWLLERRLLAAGRAFALGCLLAVPPALMNVSGMTAEMASAAEASFRSGWMAFYGLAHAPQSIATVTNALSTALVYGVPLALLHDKRSGASIASRCYVLAQVGEARAVVCCVGAGRLRACRRRGRA